MKNRGILFLLVLVQLASAQQPPAASLEGVFVKLGTDNPLAKAFVELRGALGSITTITDEGGRFFFPNVQPGEYGLSATRAGYVRFEYGQRQAGGPGLALSLAAGKPVNLRLEMTPGGIISGRLLERGKPLLSNVVAVKVSYELGKRVMTSVLSINADDLGDYHLFWLPPGRYYVVADVRDNAVAIPSIINPDGARDTLFQAQYLFRFVFSRSTGRGISDTEMHVPYYWPGTTDWNAATPIDITPGSEVRNVDINVNPVPALRVRGRVTGYPAVNAAGQPVRPTVALRPLEQPFAGVNVLGPNVLVTPDGSFEISRVSPGSYVLTAAAENLTGRVAVDVLNRDVTGVGVTLLPGLTLSGQIVIERQAAVTPDPALPALRIALLNQSLLGGFRQTPNIFTPPVTPAAAGSFSIPNPPTAAAGISPGDYRVVVGPLLAPPTGWSDPPAAVPAGIITTTLPRALTNMYVKSIRLGDTDVLNEGLQLRGQPQDPLVIVIGTNPGTLEGRVVNGQQGVGAATVVLIPNGGLRFHVNHKYTSSDGSGRFQMQAVPPGDYRLFAWERVEAGAWQNPEFVRDFESRGTPVRIDEGGKVTIELSPLQ